MAKSNTIMLIDLSVEPSKRAEFDSFCQEFYIPEFLQVVPEISTARRYAQTNISGEARSKNAHFWTVYELKSTESIDPIEHAIKTSAHRKASDQFKVWQQEKLTHFDRGFFRQLDRSSQKSQQAPWSGPSLCVWLWTVKPEVSTVDAVAHLGAYAKSFMSENRSLLEYRTYLRLDSKHQSFLTVFEASDNTPLDQLMQAFEEGAKPYLQDWLTETASNKVAMTLERIFFLPNEADTKK